MDIVKVKYYSETTKTYSEREYSYLSENGLKVGDVITVPVRDTTGKAMVTAINVPESEVAAFKDKLKVIPAAPPLIQEEPVMSYEDYLEALEEDMESSINTNTYDPISPDNSIAVINIAPADDLVVCNLREEIVKLSNYATFRVIKCDEDLTPATDDLALIARLKKAIKEKQDEYVKPIKSHLDKVQFVFKDLLACLDDIDKTNREKIAAYRAEQMKRQREAEELNRQAAELARRQAEFSGTGEFTVDTTPVEAPAPVQKVSTNMGTVSTAKVWKWELVDMSQVPEEYKIIDAAKITKVVKAGLRNIPGVRIYCDETIRVAAR
ncbi:MAG: hypothetical protein WC922_07345 [Synergistaceae bacterium]